MALLADEGIFGTLSESIDNTDLIPDIIEFVVSDAYLNQQILYPRQATLLKVMFCQDELLTDYDYDVLAEWTEGFRLPDPDVIAALGPDERLRYDGNNGIQPDVLDRIKTLRDQGARWFFENVVVIGRRGSKGHLGGLAGAYVLYHYIAKGNPQEYYGIDPNKTLACFVYAAKKEQAKANQWRDLVHVIANANCFQDYYGRNLIPAGMPMAETMKVHAPNDYARIRRLRSRGVTGFVDPSFEILPKESTLVSGRGPATYCQYFDEMAHVVTGVAKASAEQVYDQSKPSLDQFGQDGYIYEGSSTWQMLGQFYENWEQSLEIDRATGTPAYPERFMVHLRSWDPYEDYEHAHQIERVPIGWSQTHTFHIDPVSLENATFRRIRHPIESYDDKMEREQRANPETFAVERLSHWATSQMAYLNPVKVDAMFGRGMDGERLSMVTLGILNRMYVAHGDPSKSGANFGFAVGHTEGPDDDDLLHVVFDYIHAWRPMDFLPGEDGVQQINYLAVEGDLKEHIRAFNLEQLTFDQFNSVATIQRLQSYVRATPLPKRCQIWERTATAPQNWKVAETFKAALNMGLVHAPEHELAKAELKFLEEANGKVDHPTSGPVQTKDVADCLMIVTYALVGEQMSIYLKKDLGTPPGAMMQHGMPEAVQEAREARGEVHAALSNFRAGVRSPATARGRGMPPAQMGRSRGPRTGGGVPRIRRK